MDSVEQLYELSRISQLSTNTYGVPDEPYSDKSVLVLWNDQRHSFTDVNDMVKKHLHKSKQFGEMVGKHVDQYGRGNLVISGNWNQLLDLKNKMELTNFVFTIRTLKDHFREEMCDCIIHWLEDISKASINGNYCILRDLIAKALCSAWRVGNSSLLGESTPVNESMIPKISSSLSGTSIPEIGLYSPQLSLSADLRGISPILRHPKSVPKHWLQDGPEPPDYSVNGVNYRIQYLIFFDIRLWKSLRTVLKDLYISVLVSNTEYKTILGHCYTQLYPQVAELYILSDREPECSIFNSLSTQLFTTPSVATIICQYNYFSKYMAGLFNFFTQFRIGTVQCVSARVASTDIVRALKNRRFGQLFHDFEYILNRNTNKALVTGNVNRIAQLCDFLTLFQGVLPMVRQKEQHVEFEPELWVSYFNCMPSVLQLACSIAIGISSCDKTQVEHDISTVAIFIFQWLYGSNYYDNNEITGIFSLNNATIELGLFNANLTVQPFRVEDDPVSLHHPLHALLSWLIQYGGLESSEDLKKLLIVPTSHYLKYSSDDQLAILFDYPIRVLVLLSQIRIGLWVRNGLSVRSQMSYYRDITLRDHAFSRDIFMVQTALVTLDPQEAMLRLMHRWGLLQLESNQAFDENQRIYTIEDFLHYLIVFIVERRQLMGLSVQESKKKYIFKEIIQCLAFGPLSFSEICSTIPDSLTSDEMFETILSDICNFKPPVGIRDTGRYELKIEYMKFFDTRYLFFSPSRMYDAENVMKQHLQKQSKKTDEFVVIEPYIEPISSGIFINIGGFTRTPAFASFVYSLLIFVLNEDDENDKEIDVVMSLLLHLCHVAALDDLNISGPQSNTFAAVLCADYDSPSTSFEKELAGKPNVAALLFHISRQPQFKSFKATIHRILELLHSKDPQLVETLLKSRFGDVSIEEINPKALKEKANKNNMQKLAKRKKKKIMEKFLKQQQMFVEQNVANIPDGVNDAPDLTDEDMDKEDWHFTGSQCILCHMPCDSKKIFGIVANIQISNAHRVIPFGNPDWVMNAFGMSQDLCDEDSISTVDDHPVYHANDEWKEYQKNFEEENIIGPGFPKNNNFFTPVISSCCHTLHQDCYTSYLTTASNRPNELTRNNTDNPRNGEILCPLCRSLNNTFVPVLWRPSSRDFDQELQTSCSFGEFLTKVFASNTFAISVRNPPESLVRNLNSQCIESLIPHYSSVLGVDGSELEESPDSTQLLKSLNSSVLSVARIISRESLSIRNDPSDEIKFSLESLFDCVSGTITDVELSLRGVDTSAILLSQIPPLTLTLLRVLSEHTSLTVAYSFSDRFKTMKNQPLNEELNFLPLQLTKCRPFEELVKCSFYHAPGFNLDKRHLIRAYFLREITNVLICLVGEFCDKAEWTRHDAFSNIPLLNKIDESSVLALSEIVTSIRTKIRPSDIQTPLSNIPLIGTIVFTLLTKLVTPFLRKCAILVHSFCTTEFIPPSFSGLENEPEANRLCDLLQIPRISDLVKDIATSGTESFFLVNKFILNFDELTLLPLLDYPATQRLLHLPTRLDQFFTNPEMWSDSDEPYPEPAVCLFCGETVSAQQESSFPRKGECNAHRDRCGRSVGIFLLPKRSAILFLTKTQGSFFQAPYLDLHGEGEDTFRRRRPQYLNTVRYGYLGRTYWLQHGIVDYISRRLSSAIDVGGWDTL